MLSGVYIGKSNTGNYDLISTGDFIRPIISTFKLRDSKSSLTKDIPLYVIINDIDIESINISLIGRVTAIRQFVSWSSDGPWGNSIQSDEHIDATTTTIIKPFYTRIIVDDFLEYFNISKTSAFTQYKLKLMYV